MTSGQEPPGRTPLSLGFLEGLGPAELLYPPAQAILPGVRSWLSWPYAMLPGYRLLRLDVHVPDRVDGPIPVVVFAPGGAWRFAGKNQSPWLPFLARGFAVVSIEYRLSEEAQFPAPLHDVKAAIRWTRAHAGHFGLDPARIAGWGTSAGGYLMAMAGVTQTLPEFEGEVGEHRGTSSALAGVIAYYPPTDLAMLAQDSNHLPGATEPWGTASSPETRLLGYPPAARPEAAAAASIARYLTRETVPMLLIHGDADPRVGISQSIRLLGAAQAAGADVALHIANGAAHGGPDFMRPDVLDMTCAFLRRVLGPGLQNFTN